MERIRIDDAGGEKCRAKAMNAIEHPPLAWVENAAAAPDRAGGVRIRALGRTDYVTCWSAMRAFTDARTPVTPNEIWLTEHAPVYTLGLAGRGEHVLRDNGIAVIKTDRGGQVTYHGPGQLIAYTLVDLKRINLGVRDMVRRLEAAVVEWLAAVGIVAYGKVSAPGIYVLRGRSEAKIAALGLKVRNGCTYHGLSLNIAMNLAPFADINPCGFPGLPVTHVADFGVIRTAETAGAELAPILARRLT